VTAQLGVDAHEKTMRSGGQSAAISIWMDTNARDARELLAMG
jgi:hypothetical protein